MVTFLVMLYVENLEDKLQGTTSSADYICTYFPYGGISRVLFCVSYCHQNKQLTRLMQYGKFATTKNPELADRRMFFSTKILLLWTGPFAPPLKPVFWQKKTKTDIL